MIKSSEKFCAVTHALGIIGGKWKIIVISQLVNRGTLRFKELERVLPNITPKMLIKVLKDLEAERLVSRRLYPAVPPRVEYTVTPLGESLTRLIHEIHHWGEYHQQMLAQEVAAANAPLLHPPGTGEKGGPRP